MRGARTLIVALLGAASLPAQEAYHWDLPRGFPAPLVPPDNP